MQGCLAWDWLIKSREENGIVNLLEFSELVGTYNRLGRLVSRLHREVGVVEPSIYGSSRDSSSNIKRSIQKIKSA